MKVTRHVSTFVYILTIIIFSILLFFNNNYIQEGLFRKKHRAISVLLLALHLVATLFFFPLYLQIIITAKKKFLKLFFFTNVALVLLMGCIIFAVTGQPLFLIVLLPFLFFILLSYLCFRNFFKLAQLTIETTLETMKPHFGNLLRNYLLKAVLFVSLLSMCSFALLKIGDENKKQRTPLEGLAIAALYFSAFFLVLNLSYILFLHGAAFCNEQMRTTTDPWNRSYDIANHFSQASVALASLLLSLVYTAKLILGDDQSNNGSKKKYIFVTFFDCLLLMLVEALEFLSAQSLVYVAIYGKSFCKSGKLGFKSLKQKGFIKYVSWNIVSQLLSAFSLFFGLMVAFLGGLLTYSVFGVSLNSRERTMCTINVGFSLLISFLFATENINSFIGGYVACQIVLFLEDPELIEENYKEIHLFRKYMHSS